MSKKDTGEIARGRPKEYTDEELLNHLCELADGDKAPTKAEVNSAEGPSAFTYQYHFESYNAAVEEAGLVPNRRGGCKKQYTDEELLDHLRELAGGEKAPTRTEVASVEGPSDYTYRNRFGSYNTAIKEAGLTPNARSGREQQYTDKELLNYLQELADGDEAPSKGEVDSVEGPSAATYEYRFESYNVAVKEAGLTPNPPERAQEYTDEELLNHLRELSDGDEAPIMSEVDSAEGPSADTYHRRFGSFRAAVEEVGLAPNTPGGKQQYSDEELLDWIRSFVFEFGVVPTQMDVRSWPGPAPTTYQRRFGSWKAAVREARVDEDN